MTTKSWKPAVDVGETTKWSYNALRFATYDEAMAAAIDLMARWVLVREIAAHESEDPVNYRWDKEKGLVAL